MAKQMERAVRMANTSPRGLAVLNFIKEPKSIEALISAADRGVPPISSLSRMLCDRFGIETFTAMAVRQLVGVTARAVLEERGYVVVRRGARIARDPLFTSGAIYAKQNVPPPEEAPLLARLVDALSADELWWIRRYVSERLTTLGLHSERAE